MASEQPEYSYVAYIDEAGDPGINKVTPRTAGGSSEWIIVSAALIPAELEGQVEDWIADLTKAMNSHQMRDIHFQKLNATRKTLACTFLAERNVRLFAVVSNKQNMEGYQNPRAAQIPSDNWFYCWLTRILLERVTDYVYAASIKRYGESQYLKLEYSERGGLRYSQMHAYYEWLKMKSAAGKVALFLPFGDFQYSVLHPDLMRVYNHTERAGLKMPDIVASAFFKAVDIHQTRECDPTFAKLLGPRIARAPDTGQIAGYGVKLMPNWRTLDRFAVPEEQRAILRHFGYPGNQWWQKKSVEPGLV
ncbi:MAG: hypothetical protein AB7U35_08550 [Sphingobium sp.]